MTIPEPPQPALLADFPSFTLDTDVALWRIHPAELGPQWFGQDPWHRFDPPPGDVRFGTCYVAGTATGSFLETIGRVPDGVIDIADVESRVVSELSLRHPARVADFTSPLVRGRGLTAEVSAGGADTYRRCQAWAVALYEAGFAGIRYRARHDPEVRSLSYAIFGGPGVDDKVFATPSTWPMPMDWVNGWCHDYGLRIIAPPTGGL